MYLMKIGVSIYIADQVQDNEIVNPNSSIERTA